MVATRGFRVSILPGWHPIVVHFPLALVVTAALVLLAARIAPKPSWAAALASVGSWNLCLGAAAAVMALGSGLAAAVDLHISAQAHHAVSLHMIWALFATLALLLLAVWRGAGNAPESRPSSLFLLVLVAATAALIVTGYRGGQNVYRYGIGVLPPSAAVAPTGVPGGVMVATPSGVQTDTPSASTGRSRAGPAPAQ
jgi:uncharacterized membrane protein